MPEKTEQSPAEALQTLAPLIGHWTVSGPSSSGTVTYEWFDGGNFIVQRVDLGDEGRGIEYIGLDADSGRLRSHFFGTNGKILEYTYELTGSTLTIWFGGPDSPAKFVGEFDAGYTVNTGAWHWPGGGYESTMTRKKQVDAHFQAMGEFYGELAANGELVTGFGLADPSHTMTIEIVDGRPVASDGPYAEAKEVLAGFGIIDVDSHDRAVELAARFSALVETRVELRPVMDQGGQEM